MALFVLVLLVLVSTLAWVVVSSLRSRRPDVSPSELTWVDQFSTRRYQLLERLATNGDFDWLRSQRGYRPVTEKELRVRRARVLRKLLADMEGDYRRLYDVAQYLVAVSGEDRSALAVELWQQRLTFRLALLAVHAKMMLSGSQAVASHVTETRLALERLTESVRQLNLLHSAA